MTLVKGKQMYLAYKYMAIILICLIILFTFFSKFLFLIKINKYFWSFEDAEVLNRYHSVKHMLYCWIPSKNINDQRYYCLTRDISTLAHPKMSFSDATFG